ncbi:MAG: exopolyphosphatase, partial [Actinomycetia bacterium]|nr:exopolyphosphatase [Actinomycetes bacterium]
LLDVCRDLLAMTRRQRAALGPMHEGRVDVIGGGVIVVQELAAVLAERAGINELVVSEHDILDGIALSIA